nr:immunoglobulin light chain junction region [Macaca mulatta]MOX85571.1 immunoglobulin light chain junction region [Macaca mulatta]
CLQGYSNPFSF